MTSADQPVPGHTDGGPASERDLAAIELQLGRQPRGVRAVAHRCPCGLPDVVKTAPRLEDGTPFPTLYYLTCPRAASAIGRMENEGRMRRMQERLGEDPELQAAYAKAHESYLDQRAEQARADGLEPLPEGMQSTGGMPTRVKCLHALVSHELAVPGTNPFGAEALAELPEWWAKGPCVCVDDNTPDDDARGGGNAPAGSEGTNAS
jgi:uncharacterized protein